MARRIWVNLDLDRVKLKQKARWEFIAITEDAKFCEWIAFYKRENKFIAVLTDPAFRKSFSIQLEAIGALKPIQASIQAKQCFSEAGVVAVPSAGARVTEYEPGARKKMV